MFKLFKKKDRETGEKNIQSNDNQKEDFKKNHLSCKKCDGYYVIREGKYGNFGGCSNYPECKSTINVSEFIILIIKKQGVNIYSFDKKCYNCESYTKVYSYYLTYQLEKIDEFFTIGFSNVGLGDIKTLDEEMEKKYKNIRVMYSKTTNSKYYANACEKCGKIQGKNYVVDDPHEIFDSLYRKKDLIEVDKIELKTENQIIRLRKAIDQLYTNN